MKKYEKYKAKGTKTYFNLNVFEESLKNVQVAYGTILYINNNIKILLDFICKLFIIIFKT